MLKEEEIFKGILGGDSVVLKSIYIEHLPKIKRLIAANSGNTEDAEDVFQEALIFIYKKLRNETIDLNCTFGTYLYVICRNLWLAKLRKLKRTIATENIAEYDYELDENTLQELIQDDKNRLFWKHFARLNQKCRDILVMFFKGDNMKSIAFKMGYTEAYARKKKFECKQALIDKLKKDPIYKELTEEIK